MILIKYSLWRLALFVICFFALFFVGFSIIFSAVCATIVSFVLAYIFLHKQKIELADYIEERIKRRRESRGFTEDFLLEDIAIDSTSSSGDEIEPGAQT